MGAPPYTSHALLRYLERAEGVDVRAFGSSFTAMHFAGVPVNAAREKLDAVARQAAAIGAHLIVRDGLEYVMAGGRLVTVKPRNRGGLGCSGKGKARKVADQQRRARGPWRATGAELREAAE